MNRSKPCEVIGHAGADGFFSPNTERSFRHAVELGVDRIECDVTGDFDRILFLVHDQVIQHDGTRQSVRQLTLEQIRQIDPQTMALTELLAITIGKTPLLLDLKTRGLEDETIFALQQIRAFDDASVSSTYARTLRRITKAIPEIRAGLSRGQWATQVSSRKLRTIAGWSVGILQIVPLLALGKWCRATELMLNYHICVPPLITVMHRAGFRIYAWTPDRTPEFRTLLERGVDGIITHRPDRLIDTLAANDVPRL